MSKAKKRGGSLADGTQAAPQSLDVVLRSLVRLQTFALICEHVSEYVGVTFRATETRGPRKLLLFPNGTRCAAEQQDVLEIEDLLGRLAFDAREKLRKVYAAGVVVEPEVVARDELPRIGIPSPPSGEGVIDSAATRANPEK